MYQDGNKAAGPTFNLEQHVDPGAVAARSTRCRLHTKIACSVHNYRDNSVFEKANIHCGKSGLNLAPALQNLIFSWYRSKN